MGGLCFCFDAAKCRQFQTIRRFYTYDSVILPVLVRTAEKLCDSVSSPFCDGEVCRLIFDIIDQSHEKPKMMRRWLHPVHHSRYHSEDIIYSCSRKRNGRYILPQSRGGDFIRWTEPVRNSSRFVSFSSTCDYRLHDRFKVDRDIIDHKTRKHGGYRAIGRGHGTLFGNHFLRKLSWTSSFTDSNVSTKRSNDRERARRSGQMGIKFAYEVDDSSATRDNGEKSSNDDLDSDRKFATERLLDKEQCPIGFLTQDTIHDAEFALELWVSDRTKEGFEYASAILDRLVLEQEFLENNIDEMGESRHLDHYQVRTFLLNRVVDGWRTCWKDNKIECTTPFDILETVAQYESRGLPPNSRTFTMIIDAMISRGNQMEAPLMAQWLLDRRLDTAMAVDEEYDQGNSPVEVYDDVEEEKGWGNTSAKFDVASWARPDAAFINNVIRAWAKSGRIEAPEMADELLQLMHDLHVHKGWSEAAPDSSSYAVVIEAWYNSRHPIASRRIEELLEDMKSKVTIFSSQEDQEKDRGGDRDSYASIAYTYALSKFANEGEPHKAYNVLQEMLRHYYSGSDDLSPKISNFSKVMASFAQKGNIQRVDELLQQLKELRDHKNGCTSLEPNQECLKARLMALSRSGNAHEAQSVLDSLVERALSVPSHDKVTKDAEMPKRSYFVDVLVAWTKQKDKFTASEMAEKVLIQLLDLSSTKYGYSELLPDNKCFEKVMQSWSNVRHDSAGERIESLLLLMDQLYQQQLQQYSRIPVVKPTCRAFEYAISSWSRSSNRRAPERAQRLIEDLEKRYASSSGDPSLRPSRGAYTSLMLTWQRSRRDNAPLMVEAIFDSLASRFYEDRINSKHLRPDAFMYSVLMGAWADQGNTEKARLVLDRMLRDYAQNSNYEAKPDIKLFNNLLKAWSMSSDPNKGQNAEAVILQMKQWSQSNNLVIQPDHQTYNEMILAWSEGGGDPSAAAERAEYYLQQLKEQGLKLSLVSYRAVIDAWSKTARANPKHATARCKALLEEVLHGIQVKQIRPPLYKPYRKFLRSIAQSPIPVRNKQAIELLKNLPVGHVPKGLFPQ